MAVNANLDAALQSREYDEIARAAVEAAAGGPILDWGCGEGQLTSRMTALGGDVTPFDFDPEADGVEELPLRRFGHITSIRSNAAVSLPFEDDRFAVVLSCGVLEHVPQPFESLLELRRVLRVDGELLVHKLPNRYSALEFVARVGGLPYHGMRLFDTLWNVRSTTWALFAAGFDVADVRRANVLPLTLDHPTVDRHAELLWRLNRRLAAFPGLGVLATNVEARAIKPAVVERREIFGG
jgi:SAM-dependent methyltransferase